MNHFVAIDARDHPLLTAVLQEIIIFFHDLFVFHKLFVLVKDVWQSWLGATIPGIIDVNLTVGVRRYTQP